MRSVISYIVKGVINKNAVYYIAKPKGNIDLKCQEKEIDEVICVDIDKVIEYLEFDNIKKLWNEILVKIENYNK